ncbi:MAG: hypothetical protein KKE30_19595 [Gammaproteobacteria bacterium]|nr:hypothetical protein [Gammaproteobacteria bacterium]MBU2182634.1 hypothetical protein [Gammaproteobacteria bacterium]
MLYLQQLKLNPVAVTAVSRPAGVTDHLQCQTQGQVKAAGGYAYYVDTALRSELAKANLLDDNAAVQLTGILHNVTFNSWKNSWQLALELTSSNGHKLNTQTTFRGEAVSLEEETSCRLVAQSMSAAVQQLLQQTLTSDDFVALLQPIP